MHNDMNIRPATTKDFEALYAIGLATPEFKVSSSGEFMEPDEFLSVIENPFGTFLLAEDGGAPVGFLYANRKSDDRGLRTQWACLVYLVVKPEYRKQGVAQALYDACMRELKAHGVTNVYGWACVESDGSILRFLEKQGFSEGHKYAWMDKKL